MIPTSDAISPSVQSVHALAKTFTIKKKMMTKKEKMMKRAAFRKEKISMVVLVCRCLTSQAERKVPY
jgi:hypothetical protein